MLARMSVALEPDIRPVSSQMLSELKELNIARQALIKDRTAASNREKTLTLPLLKRQNARRRKQIDTQIAALEAEMQSLIARDQQLAKRLTILESIPGISTITAVALLIEMPELGTLDGKQAASLAGLAPVARQSGRWTGRAFIRGGRASLRQALYMPALVAARFNIGLRAKYRKLIAPENQQKSPLPRSCEISSSSQTPSCAINENGRKIPLDQNGCSKWPRWLRSLEAMPRRRCP